jgi:hypothetical protein
MIFVTFLPFKWYLTIGIFHGQVEMIRIRNGLALCIRIRIDKCVSTTRYRYGAGTIKSPQRGGGGGVLRLDKTVQRNSEKNNACTNSANGNPHAPHPPQIIRTHECIC